MNKTTKEFAYKVTIYYYFRDNCRFPTYNYQTAGSGIQKSKIVTTICEMKKSEFNRMIISDLRTKEFLELEISKDEKVFVRTSEIIGFKISDIELVNNQ